MTDDSIQSQLQNQCNTFFYEAVMGYYASSCNYITHDAALEILIKSLSTNLGLLLAQLPENLHENWNQVALDLTSKSIVDTTKRLANISYGYIGHA